MNERIKQLAKQAGLDDDICPLDEWDHPELEKFAELIVQECLAVINAEIDVTPIAGEYEIAWLMGMECGMGLIKKHFGVES